MHNAIRNVAIIAHVDHGKTTLVDALLKQSHTKLHKDVSESLIMDSNELEQERGITIFSKNASVVWNGTKINIVDTPGHADFGGEVERVLKMADGCLLLVDAKEGPMPQTRFVLRKALDAGLTIIVVVNKIDRPDARIHYTLDKTLDLFLDLGADDAVADFPIVYASAKTGKAGLTEDMSIMTDITPVFDMIIDKIPAPSGNENNPLQILITTLTNDSYKGRLAIGRIYNGTITSGQEIAQMKRDATVHTFKVTSLMTFEGLEKVEVKQASTGDIIAVAGIVDPVIGETIADSNNPIALPLLAIEEPTIRVNFMVNNSPFAGREGEFKTSRQIKDRLYKELETDMALRIEDNTNGPALSDPEFIQGKSNGPAMRNEATNGWIISGRGELHIAIFIERMRREGYEFQVARPHVIDKQIQEKMLTPYEKVYIEVPEEYSGMVIQKLGQRRGELIDMRGDNKIAFMEFVVSTRGLFGYRSEFVTDTKGLGIINTLFYQYNADNGYSHEREQGSLVAFESGITNAYAITNIQDRGGLFIGPGVEVYKGQVIGQNARNGDLRVNICKTKQLTNMRSKGEGTNINVKTPRIMGLEDALEYIGDDELVEVTPQNIRIRKVVLDEAEERRKRSQGIQ
ncbi:MAG: GTP-binding protein TypA [Candidatus Levybacteria bacterium RIFCSPLOWO2_01_FULL_42_15]|nr:MAG: GTP-binding protein TypA [Candidatus Levybacteria bacterium RIFCSPLOWO2_01_FULL_42_15]